MPETAAEEPMLNDLERIKVKDAHGDARAHFHGALRLIVKQSTKGYLSLVERTELKQRLLNVRQYLNGNPCGGGE